VTQTVCWEKKDEVYNIEVIGVEWGVLINVVSSGQTFSLRVSETWGF
jgi:hypothetical protein